jgi:hypothetical protein
MDIPITPCVVFQPSQGLGAGLLAELAGVFPSWVELDAEIEELHPTVHHQGHFILEIDKFRKHVRPSLWSWVC